MKIGIIGVGSIGSTLARKLSAAGHEVKIANTKGPESLQGLAQEAGATAVSAEDAIKNVGVVILSIPFGAFRDVAPLFRGAPDDLVVIDTSNYYTFRDGNITEVDEGKVEGVWASEQIGMPLVKAWNAVLAATLADRGKPRGAPGRIALPVAGDDERAKGIAMQLVDETGFDPVDAGILAESWRQQPGTPGYCTELGAEELQAALARADKDRAPRNRDALMQAALGRTSRPTHDEIIAANRAGSA